MFGDEQIYKIIYLKIHEQLLGGTGKDYQKPLVVWHKKDTGHVSFKLYSASYEKVSSMGKTIVDTSEDSLRIMRSRKTPFIQRIYSKISSDCGRYHAYECDTIYLNNLLYKNLNAIPDHHRGGVFKKVWIALSDDHPNTISIGKTSSVINGIKTKIVNRVRKKIEQR